MTMLKDFAFALFWSVVAVGLGVAAAVVAIPGSF
jgi:hypothetical protein